MVLSCKIEKRGTTQFRKSFRVIIFNFFNSVFFINSVVQRRREIIAKLGAAILILRDVVSL